MNLNSRPFEAVTATVGIMLLAVCLATSFPSSGSAQETPAPPVETPPAETPPADGSRPKAAAFEQTFAEWKESLKELQAIQVRYQDARNDAAAAEAAEAWEKQLAQCEQMLTDVRKTAIEAFREAPNEDETLTQLLLEMLADDAAADRYEQAYPIAKALAEQRGAANADLLSMVGEVCFCVNDFDGAADAFSRVQQQGGSLSDRAATYASLIDEYKQYWKEEQEARKRDAESNLPRVSLKTNRGEIVLELFENEAPGTVGNFISLVEKKFYDGLTFHRVLEHFMAQGGCPQGTGTGGPGYEIYCECYQDNHRKHFRGSISMAHAGRDTGGSQFFLTFVPTHHLNGKHTVFGRVIDGIEVLGKLKRREPNAKTAPDRIIEARVIRKDENKKYEPNRVK